MWAITEKENQKIIEFRGRVEELLKTEYTKSDLYLIRWLRARKLNLDAAESMIREHHKWRADKKIEVLLATPPDNYFTQNFKYWVNGVDLKGGPVLCVDIGAWDVRKAVDDGKTEELVDYISRMFERVIEGIVKANERRKPDQEPVTYFTLIVDWETFTGRQTASIKAVTTLLNGAKIFETHYPEVLGQAFFINTNAFFQIFFALLKPLLAPRTLSKIECYGRNRAQWEPLIRAAVDEHQLLYQFGG